MTLDPHVLARSIAIVEPIADKVAAHFYAILFLENPHLRELFPVAMDAQRDRLFSALVRMVRGIHDLDALMPFLEQLGRDHRKYGVEPEQYKAVGRALIMAVSRFCASQWTDEMQESWLEAYGVAAKVMIEAAEEDAKHSPAWWIGEVVSHELRCPDVAVLTIQPDRPLTYRAGQYVMLETPWWPRVWRSYSIANAPRDDGLLQFHVKAVPAGWVSNALVHRAGVGDRMRLGPAMGSMVLDPNSDTDVVCVAGSTGLAPVKALVEELERQEHDRSVQMFFGTRKLSDLYDLPALRELARRNAWFNVVPAVSDEPCDRISTIAQGTLPEVLSRYGRWTGHDAYVSGNPGMVKATTATLHRLGVASPQIHYEAFDLMGTDLADLVAASS